MRKGTKHSGLVLLEIIHQGKSRITEEEILTSLRLAAHCPPKTKADPKHQGMSVPFTPSPRSSRAAWQITAVYYVERGDAVKKYLTYKCKEKT